jgi:hypothetical protein
MSTLYVDNLQPNLGSGVHAAGHVVQIQNTSTLLSGTISSTTPVDLLSISFTPKFDNSSLYIVVTHRWQENTNVTNAGVAIVHDGTNLLNISAYNTYAATGNMIDTNTYQGFVASTGSTSARDIKFQHWCFASGGNLIVNPNVTGAATQMTVMEIAQ